MVKTHLVTATDFKAKCLALLNEIELHGETITITRRGKPVAVLGPAKQAKWVSPKDSVKGEIVGDIVNHNFASAWNIVNGED